MEGNLAAMAEDKGTEETGTEEKPEEKTGEYVPPTKEEWEKTTAALKSANGEAADYRHKYREAQKAAESSSSKKTDGDGDKVDAAKIRSEAAAEVEKQWKPRLAKSAARTALIEGNAKKERVDRLVDMIRLDELDVNDDGTVSGLQREIDRLREDLPELFATKRRSGGSDAGEGNDGKPAPKSASERQAAAILRRT